MTQYVSILYGALGLNILALFYRGYNNNNNHSNTKKKKNKSSNGNNDMKDQPQQHKEIEVEEMTKMKQRHYSLLYKIFLPVYLLAVIADWLQGPYKYDVYSSYGYTQHSISILFVAGFGSGMSLGSIIGGLADTIGRKRMVLVYCCIYSISCLLKHFRSFTILLVGRVLGGIATSLLFSVFDSWLIKEHTIRNIDKTIYLSESFSIANFGSSVVAILAGFIANVVVNNDNDDAGEKTNNGGVRPFFTKAAKQWMVEEAEAEVITITTTHNENGEQDENWIVSNSLPLDVNDKRWDAAWVYKGGGISAFDLAVIPLILCFIFTLLFWDENYGTDTTEGGRELLTSSREKKKDGGHKKKVVGGGGGSMFDGLYRASITIWRSPAIFNLCAVTSFFEGAMYVFILLWTPALRALDKHPEYEEEHYPGPPLGIVFSTFMVCCMFGTSIFAILSSSKGIRPSKLLVFILTLSSISCLVVSTTSNDTLSYLAMLLFEACIGAYYPAMSTVKGNLVPEDQRAAIYSCFRLPMNIVVLLNLFSNLEFQSAFGLCFLMLSFATLLQIRIMKWDEMNFNHNCNTQESSSHYNQRQMMRREEEEEVELLQKI